MLTLESIRDEQFDNFDYCEITTNNLAVIGENSTDEITVFFTPETAKQYELKKEIIIMKLLWTKEICYKGTDTISYCIRAYKGGGLFATTNYEKSDFGIYQDKPLKKDF